MTGLITMPDNQNASEAPRASRRGHGNGLRIHVLLFSVMSALVLVGFVALIAATGSRM